MQTVSTFKIKNRRTGVAMIINQSDYQPHLSLALGGDWEITERINNGTNESERMAINNRSIIDSLKLKRQAKPLIAKC